VMTMPRHRRACPGPAPLRGEGPCGRASRRIPDPCFPTLPIFRPPTWTSEPMTARGDRPSLQVMGADSYQTDHPGAELTQNHASGRAIGMLLTPVFAGALVLTFTVMQARTTTVHAPGPGGRREYGSDLYAVRLSDTFGDTPNAFTAQLTGRQVAALSATSGVVSVSRLPARATLSDCYPVTSPAGPDTVPSPSPLPAPSPPAEDGVGAPDRGHAAQIPSPAAIPSPTGAPTRTKKEAASAVTSPSDVTRRLHGRPGGMGVSRGPATSKAPTKR
jgi:hypothetical protein